MLEDDVLDLLSKADVQQSLTVSARTTNVQRSETAPLGVSHSQQNYFGIFGLHCVVM